MSRADGALHALDQAPMARPNESVAATPHAIAINPQPRANGPRHDRVRMGAAEGDAPGFE
jgi:hypothetical protein